MEYGIFKQLANDNPYLSLTKCLNSARCTRDTQRTLKRITLPSVRYAHMGQLVIHQGICYATFLQNFGEDGEEHSSNTSGVVLATFSLQKIMSDTFDAERDIEFYPIGKKGDTCSGYVATSIFKDNSMCLVGEILHICFSFTTEDGSSRIFRKSFDILKKIFVDEALVVLSYKGERFPFSDESINLVYQDKGLLPRARGLIELVSQWSEYQGEYYVTGITIDGANNGFVVKTKDFSTMTLVDVIPFNDMGTAEVGSYIYRDKLFVACRQDYGIPYLYLGYFDLKTNEWKHFYKLPDGNCRPWFFEHQGALYLIYSPDEKERRYTSIARIRTEESGYSFFDERIPVEIMATVKNCGFYWATAKVADEVYFVSTCNTESFGRLSLDFYDEDLVNERLIEWFKNRPL